MTTELAPIPDRPALPDTGPVPARRLLDAWLTGRSPRTVRAYSQDLEDFRRFFAKLGSFASPLDTFLSMHPGRANEVVLDYKNSSLAAGLASATVARRLAALRSLVKLANTLGIVTWSIGIASPRVERRRDVRGPDEPERKRIFRVMKGLGDTPPARRDRAIVALLFGLGLRRAEVVSLDLADVDFRASTVRVLGKVKPEQVEMVHDMKGRLYRVAQIARATGLSRPTVYSILRGPDAGRAD
jgi:integrase/recombinase XerC